MAALIVEGIEIVDQDWGGRHERFKSGISAKLYAHRTNEGALAAVVLSEIRSEKEHR